MKGAWRNPESGEVEYDDSWRSELGIDPSGSPRDGGHAPV